MTVATVDAPIARARRLLDRWRPVLTWWAASRLVTLAAFVVLELAGPQGYFGQPLYAKPLALLSSWDGVWYARIAQHGYLLVPGAQSDPAFFPLYPIVLRLFALAKIPPTISGPIVSNLALAVALVAFYELSRRVVGDRRARTAAIFASLAPMGFVYSMSYPTSLLFALASVALLAAYEDHWLAATVCAALAALDRPEAVVLTIPLAAVAWRRRGALDARSRGRAVAAVVAPVVSIATYPLYLKWALGDAHAWWQAERHWGRSFSVTGPITAIWQLPTAVSAHPGLIRDVVLLVAYLAATVVAARAGIGWEWIAAGTAVVLLPLFSGSFESDGRFGLLDFPVYWSLGSIAVDAQAERRLRIVLITLLVAAVMGLPYMWP